MIGRARDVNPSIGPEGAPSQCPKSQDWAAGRVHTEMPFKSGRIWQKGLLGKASFALNLERKALKITLKTLPTYPRKVPKKARRPDED